MTAGEVAALSKVKPQTIYLWASKKRIPSVKVGSALRFGEGRLLVIRCDCGEMRKRGAKFHAVPHFIALGRQTDVGFNTEHRGIALMQWYELPGSSVMKSYSKYGQAWILATGRAMTPEDYPSPRVFEGKLFLAEVGYRSDLDGAFSYKHTQSRKPEKDFLRVHLLREKIEENRQTHMGHVHVHEHVDGHEHDSRTSTSTKTSARASGMSIGLAEVKVLSLRVNQRSKQGNERRPQVHHASSATWAPSTAAAPALAEVLNPEGQQRPGTTPPDAIQTFGVGAKLVSKYGKPAMCTYCEGPIVGIIEANGNRHGHATTAAGGENYRSG